MAASEDVYLVSNGPRDILHATHVQVRCIGLDMGVVPDLVYIHVAFIRVHLVHLNLLDLFTRFPVQKRKAPVGTGVAGMPFRGIQWAGISFKDVKAELDSVLQMSGRICSIRLGYAFTLQLLGLVEDCIEESLQIVLRRAYVDLAYLRLSVVEVVGNVRCGWQGIRHFVAASVVGIGPDSRQHVCAGRMQPWVAQRRRIAFVKQAISRADCRRVAVRAHPYIRHLFKPALGVAAVRGRRGLLSLRTALADWSQGKYQQHGWRRRPKPLKDAQNSHAIISALLAFVRLPLG